MTVAQTKAARKRIRAKYSRGERSQRTIADAIESERKRAETQAKAKRSKKS